MGHTRCTPQASRRSSRTISRQAGPPMTRRVLGFLLPGRRIETITEGAGPTGRERTNVATVSSDKAPREEADKPPPARSQNPCDYQVCAKAYRSFRASDCTY